MPVLPAAFAFTLDGTPVKSGAFGHGHINRTFKLTTDTGAEYVLQQINTYVFPDPVRLMSNVSAVSGFLGQRVPEPRMALRFLLTPQGLPYHRDEAGRFWRMYEFVGGLCLSRPESAEDLYQSGVAFGRFQALLSDFPAQTLYETIPDFHNTPHRYTQLRRAMAADPMGRLSTLSPELDFLLGQETLAGQIQQLILAGELPLRVTHNDTKLSNVLLDSKTRQALCVLDLDTVMPGTIVADFGDAIRFGAATAEEDTPDPGRMGLDLELYEAFTRAYLSSAGGLTALETQLLPLGAFTVAVELSVRFLTDHLLGDPYFRVHYPGHNLVRARAQMALAADMLAKQAQMQRITARFAGSGQ